MESKIAEINLGAAICEKLKIIYFDKQSWSSCHEKVKLKFNELKSIAKKFYSDKTELEVLKELIKYTNQDIIDLFFYDKE